MLQDAGGAVDCQGGERALRLAEPWTCVEQVLPAQIIRPFDGQLPLHGGPANAEVVSPLLFCRCSSPLPHACTSVGLNAACCLCVLQLSARHSAV